ncbi:unnamed protein product [Rotaria socialis]|uniref:Uncharacterized protein n=1 Tax=Rotaria socialis TaxID=392032 RepID=A0A817R340_9BILA|nr:unnamed protein product [Rotaria socialis]CAF3344200.1 unnamed protein product [Rotaria socialis]CAF3408799.1 unnamed protein product [Rotaria socialis]CAF4328865.1 unnamed protein product [Rotaria socialis]CAF4452462.1 unnamed protein product [Rotaria socialis]
MDQSAFVPANNISKLNEGPLKHDCNTEQQLSTKGRYVEPKIYSGLKLISTKRQLYTPRLSSPRRIQHDESSCRLSDEPSRQTTSFGQFQCFEPRKEDSFIDFNGLHRGKTPLATDDFLILQQDSSTEFDARLRVDLAQRDLTLSNTKLYRSPSLLCSSPSATLIKSMKSNELNFYSYNNFGQSSRPQYFLTRKSAKRPSQNIFRSSSMRVVESAFPWYPRSGYYGSKSTRI